MVTIGFWQMRKAFFILAVFLLGIGKSIAAPASDLTIEVSGNLLKYGGVVIVYDIPVSPEVWPATIGDNATGKIQIDARYAEVQLRYPRGGEFAYRFRAVEGTPDADKFGTQVLSIIGTDMEDRGPQMTAGFNEAYSSGGRIVRVPPIAELAGPGDADRSAARWGETQRYDDPPPADQRSARALVAIIRDGQKKIPLQCNGDPLVQLCLIANDQWRDLDALWWRAIAEQRLERLQHYALRRCYDSSWFGGGTCKDDPASDEPAYFYKN